MIDAYYETVMAFVEVGTFFIWVAFAQVFFLKYKRQRKPRFIIHMEGYDLHSMKLVWTNMSADPVYIRNIFITVERGDKREHSWTVYNFDNLHSGKTDIKEVHGENVSGREYQGTVLSGGCAGLKIGWMFNPCYSNREGKAPLSPISVKQGDVVNIFFVFFHGADKRLMGASRRFRFFEGFNDGFFTPLGWNTVSWSTTYERKKLMRALRLEKKDYPGFY